MENNEKKLNCWEFKDCCRGKEGAHGGCSAAKPGAGDGFNNGKFRGRICWAVAGTLCEDLPKGSFSKKLNSCLNCDFFKKVRAEEGENFDTLLPLEEYDTEI